MDGGAPLRIPAKGHLRTRTGGVVPLFDLQPLSEGVCVLKMGLRPDPELEYTPLYNIHVRDACYSPDPSCWTGLRPPPPIDANWHETLLM